MQPVFLRTYIDVEKTLIIITSYTEKGKKMFWFFFCFVLLLWLFFMIMASLKLFQKLQMSSASQLQSIPAACG